MSLTFLLTSCYVLSQAGPYLSQRGNSVKIEKLLADPKTDAETRAFLELAMDIKSFACELGLKEDKNYGSYKKLDKDYLAVVVSACDKYSFKQYFWSYPFLGKMPYIGYINESGLKKEIERLKNLNLDIYARKVEAFSSLGFFKDPLYSFMRQYSVYRLAELLIHEQTHAAIYFKNQSQFNEETATFIGETGAELYVISRYGKDSEQFRTMTEEKKDGERFRGLMLGLRDKLDELYSSDLTDEEVEKGKSGTISEFQEDVKNNYYNYFITENFKGLSGMTLNNAYISLFNTYTGDLDLFRKIFELESESVPAMLEWLKSLKNTGGPKVLMRERTAAQK